MNMFLNLKSNAAFRIKNKTEPNGKHGHDLKKRKGMEGDAVFQGEGIEKNNKQGVQKSLFFSVFFLDKSHKGKEKSINRQLIIKRSHGGGKRQICKKRSTKEPYYGEIK